MIGNARYEINVRDFRAKGDGTADDTAAIQAAVNHLGASGRGGRVTFPRGTYLISEPIQMKRGVMLQGSGTSDNISSTRIKLANNANCSMVQTPVVTGGAPSSYMAIEGICFDGNGQNQTTEAVGIDFRGAFVTCWLRDLLIIGNYGPGLQLDQADIQVDNVVVGNCIIPSGNYAVVLGRTDAASGTNGLLTIDHLFVENTVNEQGLASVTIGRTDPTKRGKGVLIKHMQKLVINGLHCENHSVDVTVDAEVKSVQITGFSSAWSSTLLYFAQKPMRHFAVRGMGSEQIATVTLVDRDAAHAAYIDQISGTGKAYLAEWTYVNDTGSNPVTLIGDATPGLVVSGRNDFAIQASVPTGGTAVIDVSRTAGGNLIQTTGASTSDHALNARSTGDSQPRFSVSSAGAMAWGPGNATTDTTLIRSTANRLRTDDSFQALDGLATKTKAGAPTDADFATTPVDGTMVIDTTNNKIYVRIGGTWKATAALT